MATIDRPTSSNTLVLTKGDDRILTITTDDLGDLTAQTWTGKVRTAGDNGDVYSIAISVLDATHMTFTHSKTNTALLVVGNKYEWFVGTTAPSKKTVFDGGVVVKEGQT